MLLQAEQQLEVLKRFHEQVVKLAYKKFDQLHGSSLKMSWSAGGDSLCRVKTELPSTDLLRSFLMDFRFFYIKDKNQYNFERVCVFFQNENFNKPLVTDYLRVYRLLFEDRSVTIRIDDREYHAKQIFDVILNEEHFHQENGQKGIKKLQQNQFVEGLARVNFFMLIIKLKNLICNFDEQVVKKYLEKQI